MKRERPAPIVVHPPVCGCRHPNKCGWCDPYIMNRPFVVLREGFGQFVEFARIMDSARLDRRSLGRGTRLADPLA